MRRRPRSQKEPPVEILKARGPRVPSVIRSGLGKPHVTAGSRNSTTKTWAGAFAFCPSSLHFDNSVFVPLLFSIKEAEFRPPGAAFSGVSPVGFPRGFPHTPAFEVTSTSGMDHFHMSAPRRARDVALGASGFSLRNPHPSPDQGHVVP